MGLAEIEVRCPPSAAARPPYVSEICWDLLQRLLEPNAKQRISVEDALQHEWVNSSLPSQTSARPPQQADGASCHTIGTVVRNPVTQCTEDASASAQEAEPQLEKGVGKDTAVDRCFVQQLDKGTNGTPETVSPRSSEASSAMDSQRSSPRLPSVTLQAADP